MSNDEADTLAQALERHGMHLDEDQIDSLARYVHSLWNWNEKLNLTRHTDYEKFVSRDVAADVARQTARVQRAVPA